MQKNKSFSAVSSLLIFILVVVGAGGTIGALSGPDGWYANLVKPSFNPPNYLFAPVWTLLYVMIAVAGWRIWRIAPRSTAMRLWGAQMVLNWLWTPAFFVLHLPLLALLVILALLLTIFLFIHHARQHDRLASWCFIPYAAWVMFATLLNAALAWLN